MKSFFLFSVVYFLMVYSVNSQPFKKYSGNYKLSAPWNQDGKANYSYKEENSKQIFQGKFSLLFTGRDDNKGFVQNVTGNYKNGLRDGKWVFIATYADWKTLSENIYKTGTCTLTINYKSGQPDGNWVYISSFKIRQKNEQNVKTGFTAFSKVTKENIKIIFKQGTLSSFVYELPSEDKTQVLKTSYTFDESGFLHGVSREENNKKSNDIWYHGIDKPVHEDIINIDKYLAYSKSFKDSLAYLPFSYKTLTLSENKRLNESDSTLNISGLLLRIYSNIFLWNDIPGDLYYDASKSKTDILKNVTLTGFLVRQFTLQHPKEKVLPIEQINQFNKINTLIQSLNSSLTDAKIAKCSGIADASVSFEKSKKYLDTIVILQRTVSELEKLYKGTGSVKSYVAIVETGDFLKLITESEILNYSVSKLTAINENIQPLIKELEVIYKKNEFDAAMKEGNSFIEQKNYDAAKKAFQRAQFMNPEDTDSKIKMEEVKVLEAILDADTKRMKMFNYLVDNFRKIPSNYKYGEERKNLYNAYLILKDYLLSGIDNPSNDSFKKLEICNEAVKLVDKMNELQNKNTEELEKQLKKIKDPTEIKKILGL